VVNALFRWGLFLTVTSNDMNKHRSINIKIQKIKTVTIKMKDYKNITIVSYKISAVH
jgi:hypothetical protein